MRRRTVLRDLEAIERGASPRQSPLIEEFLQCPDWQLAASILAHALTEESRRAPRDAVIAPPPGWMPPLL
ncbi:MAG: hypothetical protein R2762_29990 [Bryobacteraceae bacterium]